MKLFHHKLLKISLLSLLLAIFSVSCSADSELVSRAEEEGEKAARNMIEDMPMSEMDMQNRILTIMNHEYELRRDGHPEAAEAYIDSFIETLSNESDSLTTILGYEKTTD